MEIDSHAIEKLLKCQICYSIPENPFETNCCGSLYCERCIDKFRLYKISKCLVCEKTKILLKIIFVLKKHDFR